MEKKRLYQAYHLTQDLVESLSPENLTLKLDNLPSNSIGEQFWCIIGARESYLRAIIEHSWQGFSCSLDDPNSKAKILACLKKTYQDTYNYLENNPLNDVQRELLFTLLEHEILHHGQLIRYVYGNKLTFPKSWNERYTV